MATQAASAQSTTRPRAGGYFKTHPVGQKFPTDAQCAAKVHRSTWEPRPKNNKANHTVVRSIHLPKNTGFDTKWNQKYKPRIDGHFTGTTDEIIQWASCKWGISDELTRARAVKESSWLQSTVGDFESRSSGHCPSDQKGNPCPTSFGLLQSKWYFRPGSYPGTRVSTAFSLDYSIAELRGCIDGLQWFGPQSTGNVWGCVGVWFTGSWGNGYDNYVAQVKAIYDAKPWRNWRG
jgi:hypothetical protein